MISIKNLSKNYPKTQVFSDFSLDIKKREITCILGESGSGKTTLLNVLAGLTSYLGEVSECECSYVFQKPNLFNNMSVYQNLKLVCNDNDKIDRGLTRLNLQEKKNSYPKHLSGGQAQRVSILRGVLFDRKVLLLDEPFSNLDIAIKNRAIELIKEHHEKEKNTVILVTHEIKDAVSLADRVVVLSKGKIIFDEKNQQKKTEEQLFNLLSKLIDD